MTTRRVRIRQGDRELEIEGDAEFVAAQLDRLVHLAFGAAALPSVPTPVVAAVEDLPQVSATFTVRKNLSFDDFVALKDPESDVDRLVVLAYYHEKYESVPDYTLAELSRFWMDAWPILPFEDTIWKEGLERGFFQWLDEGRLTLSFAGQKYVRDGLA